MATLTVAQARRWSIRLPVFAGLLALANSAWIEAELPSWSVYVESIGYHTDSRYLVYGLLFALEVGVALWLTGALRQRRRTAWAAVGWGAAFGCWFPFALSRLMTAATHAFSLYMLVGGPHILAELAGIIGAGALTAVVLAWATRSVWVGLGTVLVSVATAAWVPTLDEFWFWHAPFAVWQSAIGVILGQHVLATARRMHSGSCPRCQYSLVGLPAGSPCPECGGTPTPAR